MYEKKKKTFKSNGKVTLLWKITCLNMIWTWSEWQCESLWVVEERYYLFLHSTVSLIKYVVNIVDYIFYIG